MLQISDSDRVRLLTTRIEQGRLRRFPQLLAFKQTHQPRDQREVAWL